MKNRSSICKQYLQAKFNIGQETGRKMDPNIVSSQMRKALDSYGKRLFNVSEFLSPQQVKSYFSRHAAKVRQQCDVVSEDIVAADEEANFCSLREAACSNIQLQHPIEFNQYDVCRGFATKVEAWIVARNVRMSTARRTRETSATKGTIYDFTKRSCQQMLMPDPFHVMHIEKVNFQMINELHADCI
jgi:hypothetical protein